MPTQGGRRLSGDTDHALRRKRIVFWIAAGGALVADLASKAWIFARLDTLADASFIQILPFLRLSQHVNRGMVFGVLGNQRFIIIALTSILVPAIVLVAYSCRAPRAPLWALGLLLGGALGNLYDRLFYMHPLMGMGVRDFLDLRNPWTGDNLWPVFNIADVAIVVGVFAYVAWSLLWAPAEEEETSAQRAKESP